MSAGDAVADSMNISFVEDASRKARRDWLILVAISLVIATVLRLVRIDHREFFGNEFLRPQINAGDAGK